MTEGERNGRSAARRALLYHFCRLQLPGVTLVPSAFDRHLERAFELYRAKRTRETLPVSWDHFLENLHAVDWYLCGGCLDGQERAWELLFASRANRADCLLIDALRARAVRLFPRNEEQQDAAVTEFWGFLLTGEK